MKTCDCGKLFEPRSRGNSSKMCRSCVTNRRRFSLKEKAIEYLGGKCIDCGYNKCIQALEFDHKNPKEKEFAISGNHCLSWETIKLELDKCVLRCANCHRERHANERIVPKDYEIEEHIVTTKCVKCKTSFAHIKSDNRKYCSTKCAGNDRVKINWPSIEDLTSLVEKTSFRTVAGMLGVSDNGLRKFFIRNNIDPKKIRSVKNNRFVSRP